MNQYFKDLHIIEHPNSSISDIGVNIEISNRLIEFPCDPDEMIAE